jgi:hypothetical protein
MSRIDTDGSYEYAIGVKVREGASSRGLQRVSGRTQALSDFEITVRREYACRSSSRCRPVGGFR